MVNRAVSPTPISVRIKDACRLAGIGRSKLYKVIKADNGSGMHTQMSIYLLLDRTHAEGRSVAFGVALES